MMRCEHVGKVFRSGFMGGGAVTALEDVSFSVAEGTTYALCGLSGAGKSTLGRIVLGLVPATSGAVYYGDTPLADRLRTRAAEREFRRHNQMIFQNPQASLYENFPIRRLLEEPYRIHAAAMGAPDWARILACLEKVGLGADLLDRYPAELSGGQLQRLSIARVLTMQPSFIVLDEPTAMLDPTVQVQIMHLLKDLQRKERLTYLFISHDLDLVRFLADDVGIMCRGRMVEQGRADEVLSAPREEFTREFIAAFDGF
ncbi:ABC transporter, ATP-binding protein [Selenomonas sp. FOBRC9]|uniref:ABC transporter ATP-binding protein n=1 Tax=Selenomonas sp. FOBRC9 TaxID=936573 RepID=UPI00027A3DB1|nr:ATP-binding cassette domain-containing protein [Selenomonas sp. FOBRC9]EJP28419.1 ABC transporter, ATP-binding protein [Selenomonas sp. FOBRC9]